MPADDLDIDLDPVFAAVDDVAALDANDDDNDETLGGAGWARWLFYGGLTLIAAPILLIIIVALYQSVA